MSSHRLPFIVPFRFLTSITHLITCGILLLHRKWNLIGCGLSVLNSPSLLKIKDDQYIIALSFMIGLGTLEIFSLVFGLSLYSQLQSFLSTIFHLAATIALLFFMFNRSCTDNIWSIFATCSFLPFLTEIVTAVRVCACQRLPAW